MLFLQQQARSLTATQARAAATGGQHVAAAATTPPQQFLRLHSVLSSAACSTLTASLHDVWGVHAMGCCRHQQSPWRTYHTSGTRGVAANAAASDQLDATAAAAATSEQQQAAAAQEWSVLNFYHLVDIADPEEVSEAVCVCVCERLATLRGAAV